MPAHLAVHALDAGYGETTIVRGAAFDVAPARTLSILGPSGAGKSTLLRAITGLGAVVVAQDALVRHLSVRANLALVTRGRDASARIAELSRTLRVFDAPASAAVATFLGTRPMNLLPGELFGERSALLIGILPERMALAPNGPLGGNAVRVERTGADAYVHVRCEQAEFLVRVSAGGAPAPGTPVRATYEPAALRRFDRATGAARA